MFQFGAVFEIKESKKGHVFGKLSLGGVAIAMLCDLKLSKGVDYLVYGFEEEKRGNLILTGCNATKPLSEVSASELNVVNNL